MQALGYIDNAFYSSDINVIKRTDKLWKLWQGYMYVLRVNLY